MKPIPDLLAAVRAHRPLIHCITNPISIHQCANALLAAGARPIMAEHPKEVQEITETADALLLNLGNITDVRMDSMRISAETAKERHIPAVLDAVGVACSALRLEYAFDLLQAAPPAVIKGNYSEIKALCHADYRSAGVDAKDDLTVATMDRSAAELARRYHTVVLASGKADIVTDGVRLVHIHNGTPRLSEITGTGCMLGALTGAYLSVGSPLDAAVAACGGLGICGQLAEPAPGNGSFQVALLDALSIVTDKILQKNANMEEITLEI